MFIYFRAFLLSLNFQAFLATDDDGTPIISFLLQEQKGLLSVRLHIGDNDGDVLVDVKSHMSWSIPAVDAAPVIVTRPRWNLSVIKIMTTICLSDFQYIWYICFWCFYCRVKVGSLPFTDLLVIDPDNSLRLYVRTWFLAAFKFYVSVKSTSFFLRIFLGMKESESLDLFIFFTQENLLLDGLPSYYVSLLEESIVTLKRIFHGISAHQEAFALSIVSKIQLGPPSPCS